MVSDSVETETLARLYLDQGHPERAAPIYERLLAEDPTRSSLVEGLSRCRAALKTRQPEGVMDQEKRLKIMQDLLSRLTEQPPVDHLAIDKPRSAPQPLQAGPGKDMDLRERKLQLLKTMVQRLQKTKAGGRSTPQ